MKRIIYIFLIAIILLPMSCTDDLLEPKPKSFYAPENVYNSPEGLESVLVTLRKRIAQSVTGEGQISHTHMVAEWSSTEVGIPVIMYDWTTLTPTPGNGAWNLYVHYHSLLTHGYSYIKDANVIISRIDNIEWDDQERHDALLAEAYFHRSFWYYWMVNTYGDIPFVGEEVTEAKLDYYSHSRWAILEKIQADMEANVEYLPEYTIPGAITKGAGLHLLTKIHLANLDYDKAIATSTTVIDEMGYALMTERFGSTASDPVRNLLWDLHRSENKQIPENTENIFSVVDRYDAPTDAKSTGLWSMRHYLPGWYARVRDSQGEQGTIDKFPDTGENTPMYDSLGRGNPDVVPSEYGYYEIWEEAGNTWQDTPDLRRADINWIDKHEYHYNNPQSVDYGKPIDAQYIDPQQDSVLVLFPGCYYKAYAPQQDPAVRPVGGNGDWYIYRLSETYLLRAEAYFWKGQTGDAAANINTVRERASAIPITAGDVTIDYIFDERARELMYETPRHCEMVRVSYIMAHDNINGYTLDGFSDDSWWFDRVMEHNCLYNTTDPPLTPPTLFGLTAIIHSHNVLWPIDINVIVANTQGVINQNKGYTGAENNVPPLDIIE
ncbi:MAG: RagB/SusD family nutrient uptake outer membrane protein [Bacteroidota bacterium]